MNNPWWKSLILFSSVERKGIFLLSCLIVLLLLFRLTLPLWIKPPNPTEEQNLLAEWNKFKSEITQENKPQFSENEEQPRTGKLFHFDPNNLDSLSFLELGLKPRTTHLLLNWRRKGKIFYKKEDFRTLYTLKEEEYNRLEPFIQIHNEKKKSFTIFNKQVPLPPTLELNKVDSATLVRLQGIGPVLAHKILTRRKSLGGFLKHEQLNEIYRFPDTTYKLLCEKLTINTSIVQKINLNTAGLEELKIHPYIGEKVAKNILLLRKGLQRFENIDQLRQVPLMNEEIYRKIAPYFTLD